MAGVVVMLVGVVFVAGAALAWDVPTKVPTDAKGLKDTAGKTALQTALNEKLSKANCAFQGTTTKVTGCDLKKLGQELAASYKAAKQAANYTVRIKVEAANATPEGKKKAAGNLPTGNDRAIAARDTMKTGLGSLVDSWNWDTDTNSSLGNKLSLKVKVE